MLETFFPGTWAVTRHRAGVFGTYIDGFAEDLAAQGYAGATARIAVQAVGRLGRWFTDHHLDASDTSEITLTKFCQQDRFADSTRHGGEKALRMMLERLRSLGVAPEAVPQPEPSAAEQLTKEFDRYLREERSLSEATAVNYCPEARRLLSDKFGVGPIDLTKLSAADLHAFVSRHAGDYSAKRVQLMLTALRSFLRFLYVRGDTSVRLDVHVPKAPCWRKTQIPKYLSCDEVERVLASCDRHSAIGQRDYAILLLLARLGLRASEVVLLELEDISWEAGEISVCGKGSQRKRFPLPEDAGHAIAAYLRSSRPSCDSRRVFFRTRAPYRGLGHASTLDTIVCNALARAKLDPPLKGAHLFRHSLATRMLRNGATLTEIGQVLHHASPDTTSIYAKVDIGGLRELAQPWPGDCS